MHLQRLGSRTRLPVFKALVRAGRDGANVGPCKSTLVFRL